MYASGSDSPYAMQVMAVSLTSYWNWLARLVLGQFVVNLSGEGMYASCTQ